MRENRQLTKAKSAKNDEFYTQYNDIQKEVNAYLEYNPDTFRGKTVLLPCDDPEWSNFNEMDADHVTPWSKGGATDIKNCQMLCRTHNRAKGNLQHRLSSMCGSLPMFNNCLPIDKKPKFG